MEGEKESEEKERKTGGRSAPSVIPATFRRSMIFKLSAPAYDARVKSFGVDFRERPMGGPEKGS